MTLPQVLVHPRVLSGSPKGDNKVTLIRQRKRGRQRVQRRADGEVKGGMFDGRSGAKEGLRQALNNCEMFILIQRNIKPSSGIHLVFMLLFHLAF